MGDGGCAAQKNKRGLYLFTGSNNRMERSCKLESLLALIIFSYRGEGGGFTS